MALSARPRTIRGRRPSPDRGLPEDTALRDLARTYLEIQCKLWPELISSEILTSASDKAAIQRLAEDFKQRFLPDNAVPLADATPSTPCDELGSAYLRYSCDNSNPRSLDQQLRNVLERARRDDVFIPWKFVFADAAVTGTIAARRGYQLAKSAIQVGEGGPRRLYIDEIGRASRDAIEALRLGRLIERFGKRMIGASDNFDSDTPHAKIMLSMFGMLHEWFVDQLRAKVHRGRKDAFSRGGNIHAACVGYKLVAKTDSQGNMILNREGLPVREKVIDEDAAKHVHEAFVSYTDKAWSGGKIARHFNELRIGGKQTWDQSRIMKMLMRSTYIGVEYDGMTYSVVDPETGHHTLKRRPTQEWRRRDVPQLRIIPDELWKRTQERIQKCRAAYASRSNAADRSSRTEVYPTLLFRPTCGYCGRNLRLGHGGKHSSFCCLNGSRRTHDCQLHSYKSVRIFETSILNSLRGRIFTTDYLQKVLEEANRFLSEAAARPSEDAQPIMAEIATTKAKRDRLVRVLEGSNDLDLEAVVKQVKKHERHLKDLQRKLADVNAWNAPRPSPMTVADVEPLLADLRGLLNEEVGSAAPLLAQLTGPIQVQQSDESIKGRKTWIARFNGNLVPVLAHLTAKRKCPTSKLWEYLQRHGWISPVTDEVRVAYQPRYEALAPTVAELTGKGASRNTLVHLLSSSDGMIKAAINFASKGVGLPQADLPVAFEPSRPDLKYVVHANEISRLRDEEHLSFPQIAARLSISNSTATRAYDFQHSRLFTEAAHLGRTPKRGRQVILGRCKHEQIVAHLADGKGVPEIARLAGCSTNTVYRTRKKLP